MLRQLGIKVRHHARAVLAGGVVLGSLVLTGCSDTGPIYATSSTLQPWVVEEGSVHPQSDRVPIIEQDVIGFTLTRGQRRSMLRAGDDWLLGQTYLFGFDFRADRKTLGNRPVVVSRLVRKGKPERVLAEVKADARNGVSVLGRRCIPANAMEDWHQIEMRIHFADSDTGYFEVFCDRKPIWAQSNMRTTQPPVCRKSAGCTRPVQKPVAFEWQFGLLAKGRATRTIKSEVKRVFYHRLFVIPNRGNQL